MGEVVKLFVLNIVMAKKCNKYWDTKIAFI
jgi:hypothetical protein